MTAAVPIYADDNHTVNGVLATVIPAQWLTEQIKDIVVGDTGYCFIIGNTGTNIGHKDFTLVSEQNNSLEKVKTDKSLVSNAAFLQRALDEKEGVVFYEYRGIDNIAAFTKIKTTEWPVIVKAPVNEFMGTVNTLRTTMRRGCRKGDAEARQPDPHHHRQHERNGLRCRADQQCGAGSERNYAEESTTPTQASGY